MGALGHDDPLYVPEEDDDPSSYVLSGGGGGGGGGGGEAYSACNGGAGGAAGGSCPPRGLRRRGSPSRVTGPLPDPVGIQNTAPRTRYGNISIRPIPTRSCACVRELKCRPYLIPRRRSARYRWDATRDRGSGSS
jgi:hypothetical protein